MRHLLTGLFGRVRGSQPVTLRERHQRYVDAHARYTPKQRADIMRQAAAHPGLDEAMAEADVIAARYMKGLESGEFHDRSDSTGRPSS